MRKLGFAPAVHGFHFTNTFVNQVSPGITTYGLCGGMALASARYWLNNVPIPAHVAADFPDGSPAGVPPPGSQLHDYIYACQLESFGPLGVVSAANWVTMPWITLRNQFDWSVSEFPRVKAAIDAGTPTVVGLRQVTGGPMGHQVLAYGYDEFNWRVFVYDSNYPGEEKCLRLDLPTGTIVYDGAASPRWSSYFVTGCQMTGPRPTYIYLGPQSGPAEQSDWRWCHKCQILFFSGGRERTGQCPGGGQHERNGSGNYTLAHNQPNYPGQPDWRWCHKCQGLFYSAGQSFYGICPAGGPHDRGSSGNYALAHNSPGAAGQSDWRWCHKCQGLHYSGGQPSNGRCPSGGAHEKGVSGDYTLKHSA